MESISYLSQKVVGNPVNNDRETVESHDRLPPEKEHNIKKIQLYRILSLSLITSHV